jgi:chromosome segregation ATPase
MTKLTADLEADTVRRVDAEKARMAEHLDIQMNELQDENERLIEGLEAALSDLKKQKMEVTTELETTTTKLETAEDSLYDSQQAMMMLQKKHSISSWRFASRLMNMNVIFKRELTRTRAEATEELAQSEHEGKSKLEDFIMLGMNMASVISQVQGAREKVYSTLTSYKSEVLIEKRTHIKLFEKEINRLADEKELMDEQRDNLEEELVQYEKEIEAIEVEIREHTRSSSVMQNGRINVAHARKKKRFDTELERILDLIEQKRSQINDMDDRCQVLMSQKDDKESDLADMEKDLVQILIEQQRLVLSQIEEAQVIEDKGKTLVKMSVITWPPVMNPTKDDIASCHRRANRRYRDKKGGGDDDDQ